MTMKEGTKIVATVASGIIIGAGTMLLVGRCKGYSKGGPASPDTTIIYDTIPHYLPVPVDSLAVRYDTVRLPALRDTIRDTLVHSDTIIHDSVNVIVPITQKKYEDSTYTAWVSGFRPSLDSIKVYRKTVYQEVKNKSSRIGLGVMAGYGFGKGVTTPFIGIGVFYKLF